MSEVFTFTWRIKNFSMCPLKNGSKLSSPSFTVEMLHSTSWNLWLYPRGEVELSENIGCFLFMNGRNAKSKKVVISYRLFLVSPDGPHSKFTGLARRFEKDIHWGCSNMLTRSSLFHAKASLLLKNTLTVKCMMWCTESSAPEPGENKFAEDITVSYLENGTLNPPTEYKHVELYTGTSFSTDEWIKVYTYPNKCTAVTRFLMLKQSFMAIIEHFCTRKPKEILCFPVFSSCTEDVPRLMLHCFVDKDSQEDYVLNIHIRCGLITKTLFITATISVVDTYEKLALSQTDEYWFDSCDTKREWIFPPFIKKSKLKEMQNALPNDRLSLLVEIATSNESTEMSYIEETSSPNLNPAISFKSDAVSDISKALQRLYIERELCDVTLCVRGESLSAHKAVLGARSPVFLKLFQHDMNEKNSGRVNIADVDFETLNQMVSFMYIGELETTDPEMALKLYKAACKYNVVSLQLKCAKYLKSNLTAGNVCEVLDLADAHQDAELKAVAQNYICSRPFVVFVESGWTELISKKIDLAGEVFRLLYLAQSN